jgi:hypothetical protein
MTTFINSKALKAVFGLVVALAFVASAASAQAYVFTRSLKQGMSGADVKELQMFLNSDAATKVASSGAGSPGMETMTFGPATKAAVIKFQTKYGISPKSGLFGPLSQAKYNQLVAGGNQGNNGCQAGWVVNPVTGLPCSGGTQQSGPVTAALAATNPAAGTLVGGQATANLAQFTFSGTGVVTNVVLQRIGVSADTTLSNVYLFEGATRLTDAASPSNNGMITFNNPAGIFTVSGSKTISVKADIASVSGQTVGVKLVSFTTSGATAATQANVSGNLHSIASATLATATLSGTVTPSGATINPAPAVNVWQASVNVGQRDVWMKRIALRQVGSAPASSFQNFKLYVNGVQVATATGIDAMGYVTFDLNANPVLLVAGTRLVRVDADVVSGASRTFQFSLRQAADIDLVDSSFGVNITPATSGTALPWVGSANTIAGTSGGTLTIEKDISSPSVNLVNNGSDVNLGTFKVTAFGEAIKLETIRATYNSSDDNISSLRNGRILINGVQYGSTATLNEKDSGSAYTSYTLNYTVMPGTPVMLEVHADIYDNDGTDNITAGTDTLTGMIAVGSSNAVRVDSLGTFNAPSSAVSANTNTIASTTISLVKDGTYVNPTVTLPATTFKIGDWNLTGSSVEDVLLTTLSFDVDEVTSTEFDEGDLTNLYVVIKNQAGQVVAQPSPLATVSATDNNFSINYTLAKNAQAVVELYANMSDDGADSALDAGDSFKTDLTLTGTSMVSGTSVTASGGDVDGQTVIYGAASITATVAGTSPVIAIVSDNQTVTSAIFDFVALTSAYTVDDLTFTLPAAAATVVQNVMLYDGGTLVASRPGAATVDFTDIGWAVPANSTKKLEVKLQLGTVGTNYGTAGATLTTTLTDFTATNTSTGVSAAGTESNPAGAAHIVYASVPVVSQGSVSTSLNNGIENEMYKFTIAPQGGTVAVKQLKFTVVVTDNVGTNDTLTVGSFKLFRGSTDLTSLVDIHNTAGATIESTNTLGEGSSTAIVTFATEEQISSATEYTLRATPSGFATASDDDSVNVTLAYDSSAHTLANSYLIDLDTTGGQATVGLAPAAGTAQDDAVHGTDGATVTDGPNFLWSDVSGLPHASTVVDAGTAATSSADWYNGYLVQNMPLSGVTKNI